jgi:penicillin-binding protein 1A
VAGKTGTTSSNKDGWFLGFSSGLTTGVWMGRDDARALGNLQGGNAPATAWAAFMRVAVAKRPVENFATDVVFPERLEGEELSLEGEGEGQAVDENGVPIDGEAPHEQGPGPDEAIEPDAVDEAWIDRAMGRSGDEGAEEGGQEPQ